jgi:hypothetical protein
MSLAYHEDTVCSITIPTVWHAPPAWKVLNYAPRNRSYFRFKKRNLSFTSKRYSMIETRMNQPVLRFDDVLLLLLKLLLSLKTLLQ